MRRPEEVQMFVCRRGGEEVLALHRTPPWAYWHPVSGALEQDEDPEQAALRELQEELALDASDRFLPVRYEYGYPSSDEPPERQAEWPPGTDWITVTAFIVEAPAGFEPKLNQEHDDYRWCSRNDAVALFHWPDVGEALEELWRQTSFARRPTRTRPLPGNRQRERSA